MNRTAIITGGTKGLGREVSLAFGRAGFSVVALYATDAAAAENLTAEFAQNGMDFRAIHHDITHEDPAVWDIPEIRDAEQLTLVHNACAPFSPVLMHQLAWYDFETSFRVAVKGSWVTTHALLRPMLKRGGGTIVNVLTSAMEGEAPKGFGAYLTAKHALHGLTLALAAEYAPRGVRVFSVSPGFMDTPLTERWDSRLRDAIRAAADRITDPSKAAARIVELVQSESTPGRGEDYPL